jgi:hypothetical protein
VPVLFLAVLAPRARLFGIVFLAVSVLLSLATLPQTVTQLEAIFGFGRRPLRLDYIVFVWAVIPVLWRRRDPFGFLRPRFWRVLVARWRTDGRPIPTRVRAWFGVVS